MPEVILSLFIIALSILFLWEKRKNTILFKKGQDVSGVTDQKSLEVLNQAIKKAQDILANAELEAIKGVTATTTLQTKKFEEAIETQFKADADRTEEVFKTEVTQLLSRATKIEEGYLTFLNLLRSKVEQGQLQTNAIIEQKTSAMMDKFEQDLEKFLSETEQKTLYTVDYEIKSARELIESYKAQHLKIIDENIIAILERTLSLVLAKKLTLADQVELVYEGLEKAKAEKFMA